MMALAGRNVFGDSVMTEQQTKAALRFNRRRLFLNKLIMRKRRFFSALSNALRSGGSASIGSL